MENDNFNRQVYDLFKFYKTNIVRLSSEKEQREYLVNYFEQNDFTIENAKRFLSIIEKDLKAPYTNIDVYINIVCIGAAIGTGITTKRIFVACFFGLAMIVYNIYRQITKRNKLRSIIQIRDILK